MQSLGLLILSSLSSLTVAHTPSASNPSLSLSSCILSGDPCPAGSTCTQTETCGGLCITSPTAPPLVPCTVGNNGPCPTGATCTPTMVCPPTGACGGACIATPTAPPLVPCTVGNNGPCPTGATCTPTMVCPPTGACGGACIATNFPPPPSITCVVGGDYCPTGSFCTQTETCRGLCIPTGPATPTPTSTPLPCGGRHGPQCPKKYKCVKQDGKHCGADDYCHGFCVPK